MHLPAPTAQLTDRWRRHVTERRGRVSLLIAEGRVVRACRTTPAKPGTELGGLGFRELVPGRWHANLMQRPTMAAVVTGGGAALLTPLCLP